VLTIDGDFRVKRVSQYKSGTGQFVQLISVDKPTLGDPIGLGFPGNVTVVPNSVVHVNGRVDVQQGTKGTFLTLSSGSVTPLE